MGNIEQQSDTISNKQFAKSMCLTFLPAWGFLVGMFYIGYSECWGILKIMWVTALLAFPITFLLRLMIGCINSDINGAG